MKYKKFQVHKFKSRVGAEEEEEGGGGGGVQVHKFKSPGLVQKGGGIIQWSTTQLMIGLYMYMGVFGLYILLGDTLTKTMKTPL